MIDLSIIIVSFNAKEFLLNCLESIYKETKEINYEVIVIDNGSTDGTVEALTAKSEKRKMKNLRIIANKENLGFAAANNQGIKVAKGRYILLLNQDTVLLEEALQKMLSFMDKYPQIGLAGCQLLNQDKTIQPSAGYFPRLSKIFLMMSFLDDLPLLRDVLKPYQTRNIKFYTKLRYPDWVQGAFYFLRKEAIDDVGLLNEDYFMYMEDVDYAYRLKKAGWEVVFVPEAKIIHLGGDVLATRNQRAVIGEYKGLKYYFKKHKPFWELPTLKVLLAYGAILRILIFGKIIGNKHLEKVYRKALAEVLG